MPLVKPPLSIIVDDSTVPERLHLVKPGATTCAMCGQSKFRMRFAYTDETEYFTLVADRDMTGFIDTDFVIKPYKACLGEDLNVPPIK